MTASPPVPRRDLAILLFVAATWGVNNALVKVVTQYEPPMVAATIRFAMQALMLAPFLFRFSASAFWRMLIVAVISGPLHFGFFYSAFALASNIAPITVLLQLWIPIAAVLSVALLGERLSSRQMGALALALAGIAVMSATPEMVSQSGAAGLILGAAVCWASGAVLARRFGGFPVATLQAWMALTCLPLLGSGAVLLEGVTPLRALDAPWPFWAISLLSALTAGLIGNGLMYTMVRKHAVSQTTPVLLMTPVFTALTSVLLLGEVLTARTVAGGLLTLAGLALMIRAGRA